MKIFYILIAFFFVSCSNDGKSERAEKSDELTEQEIADHKEGIEKAFADYKEALLSKNGEDAYKVIDKKTRDYYDWVATSCKEMNKEQIKELNVLDFLAVCRIKCNVSADELIHWSGKDVFVFAVDKGMISRDSVGRLELDETDITIENSHAEVGVLVRGNPAPYRWPFALEDDHWRVNLTHALKIGEPIFNSLIEKSGQTKEGFVKRLIESVDKKTVDMEKLYIPLK